MAKTKVQVSRDHYFTHGISLSQFNSYYYQLDAILRQKPVSVIEIGPGNSIITNHLREMGIKVTTVDIADDLKPDVVADIRKLPFKDSSADVVVAFEVLEHIPYKDVPKALKELKRVAKHKVIVSVPYSCASISVVWRFHAIPVIRKVFSCSIRLPYFFRKIEFGKNGNHEHYWELGKKNYPKRKLRALLKRFFVVEREFHPNLNAYHYFFILKKN